MSWFQAEPIMQLLLIFFHSVLLSLLTWGGVASGVSYLPSLFQDICHTEGRKTSSLTPEVTPIRIHASITTTRWDWSTGKAKGWSEFHSFLNFLLSNPSAHAPPRPAPFPTPRHRDNRSLNSWTCGNCLACSNTQRAIHAKFPFTLRSFIDQPPVFCSALPLPLLIPVTPISTLSCTGSFLLFSWSHLLWPLQEHLNGVWHTVDLIRAPLVNVLHPELYIQLICLSLLSWKSLSHTNKAESDIS